MICYGNYEPCGKNKSEVALVGLEDDIRSLVEPESQADSRLRNTFAYTRITAKVVRQKLVEEKNWQEDLLPKERTISNILNRMGYKLRKVQKSNLPETKDNSTKLEQKPVNDKTRCRSKLQGLLISATFPERVNLAEQKWSRRITIWQIKIKWCHLLNLDNDQLRLPKKQRTDELI